MIHHGGAECAEGEFENIKTLCTPCLCGESFFFPLVEV